MMHLAQHGGQHFLNSRMCTSRRIAGGGGCTKNCRLAHTIISIHMCKTLLNPDLPPSSHILPPFWGGGLVHAALASWFHELPGRCNLRVSTQKYPNKAQHREVGSIFIISVSENFSLQVTERPGCQVQWGCVFFFFPPPHTAKTIHYRGADSWRAHWRHWRVIVSCLSTTTSMERIRSQRCVCLRRTLLPAELCATEIWKMPNRLIAKL